MGKKSRLKRQRRITQQKKHPTPKGRIPKEQLLNRYRGMKRVAIVGIGVGHEMAPVKAEYGDIWCMNDLGTLRPCTMLWDLHDFEWTDEEAWNQLKELHKEALSDEEIKKRLEARKGRFKNIAAFCNHTGIPLMSVRKYDGTGPMGLVIKSSVAYPLEKAIKAVGTDFLNCSMAFAFAMVIASEYTHVDLFGINVETGTEWVYQRDCVSYWIGRMEGAGIKVTLNGSRWRPKTILDAQVYGFQIPQDFSHVRRWMIKSPVRPGGEVREVYTEADESVMDMQFVVKELLYDEDLEESDLSDVSEGE